MIKSHRRLANFPSEWTRNKNLAPVFWQVSLHIKGTLRHQLRLRAQLCSQHGPSLSPRLSKTFCRALDFHDERTAPGTGPPAPRGACEPPHPKPRFFSARTRAPPMPHCSRHPSRARARPGLPSLPLRARSVPHAAMANLDEERARPLADQRQSRARLPVPRQRRGRGRTHAALEGTVTLGRRQLSAHGRSARPPPRAAARAAGLPGSLTSRTVRDSSPCVFSLHPRPAAFRALPAPWKLPSLGCRA